MFSKLLKYDFKGVAKVGLPLTIAALCVSVVGFFAGMLVSSTATSGNVGGLTVFSALMLVVVIYAVLILGALIGIFVYVDFFKTFCTDQAYLTFTLPVKSTTLLSSKLTNSVIWSAISAVIMVGGMALVILGTVIGAPSTGGGSSDAVDSIMSFYDIFDTYLTLILLIVYSLNSQMLIFMVIFFASIITRKHKAVTAVALVLAANFAYSIVYGIVSVIISETTAGAGQAGDIIASIIGIVLLLASGAGYFFLTKRMMDKKLNLA